ncbi:hypothetical protein [Pseudomonas farsensis]|uniref:Capsule polysaccharide biosynthesis protein n=1 Tax=Pseudomonas farsensis TaxID=2745492 RepID=A0ABU8QU09_9PSED
MKGHDQMKGEYVVMADGTCRTVGDIRADYSVSAFQTSLFHQVCERLADASGFSGVRRKVLVNLYALKSQRVREILAVMLLLRTHDEAVQQVHVHDDIAQLLEVFALAQGRTTSMGKYGGHYIGRSAVLSVFLKAVSHRLFRLWPVTARQVCSMVRGWVDVTASMYPMQVRTAALLLYPFPYGLRRQFKFYRQCRAMGIQPRLAGLPYSLLEAAKLLFAQVALAERIVTFEAGAYERYAEELLDAGVRHIYTSDEFEAAAIALYEPLLNRGVKVLNTAHGIGLYSPYVAYSEFLGFNRVQLAFYKSRCPQLQTRLRDGKNTVLALPEISQAKSLPVAVVLLDQNFIHYGCLPEAAVLLRSRAALAEYCAQRTVPYLIKVHPNTKDTELSALAAPGAVLVRQWEALQDYRLIFLAINSTAFYDVQGHAPALIYKDDAFFPEVYFGDGLLTFNVDDLASKLDPLLDEQNWLAAARRHAER